MPRDPFEYIVSHRTPGIYESNYLKANSPDGQTGLWIKHNLLRSDNGNSKAEFWFIMSFRDAPPVIAKKEMDLGDVELDSTTPSIRSKTISLGPTTAKGEISTCHWDLGLSGADSPLFHFPWDWMYTAKFPKKKAITPAPHLKFNGTIHIGDQRFEVIDWEGIRGHNWGTEHAWTYAYGNCQIWDDGARRSVDGFSARIKLFGGMRSPWLTTVVSRNPHIELNKPTSWFGAVDVGDAHWNVQRKSAHLTMQSTVDKWVGLRSEHPDGAESYCYNTKFARVSWRVGQDEFTSKLGELEILTPTPLPNVQLHPPPNWTQKLGDYFSQ